MQPYPQRRRTVIKHQAAEKQANDKLSNEKRKHRVSFKGMFNISGNGWITLLFVLLLKRVFLVILNIYKHEHTLTCKHLAGTQRDDSSLQALQPRRFVSCGRQEIQHLGVWLNTAAYVKVKHVEQLSW